MLEWQLINDSGQRNYISEVSRLFIASPRLRPMETFFLILFSSLIGIDAPYLIIILSFFSLLFTRWLPQCCVDTGVLIQIVIYFFIIVNGEVKWCLPISSRQFQDLVVTSINSFLAGISFHFSDRRHRIHPCCVVFFLICSYLLISLSVMMMSSSEVMMMVSSAGV